MPRQPKLPKSQFEISSGKSNKPKRGYQTRRDNDNVRDYKVKLKNIDEAVVYYLDNIVLANVKDDNDSFKIPVIYGSPERWKSVGTDGYYKDIDGKIQTPLVMFRRTGMSKNRELSSKIDGNFPQLFQIFSKAWSKKNAYIPFAVLNNISPVLEQYNVIVPDYVNLTYEFIVWTDYVDQMNDILEAILYSEGSYWGEPEKFKFRTRIDDYSNQTDLDGDNDRVVRATFTLNLAGYIITDSLNKTISNQTRKINTNYTIKINQETTLNGITEDNDLGYTKKILIPRSQFTSGSRQ